MVVSLVSGNAIIWLVIGILYTYAWNTIYANQSHKINRRTLLPNQPSLLRPTKHQYKARRNLLITLSIAHISLVYLSRRSRLPFKLLPSSLPTSWPETRSYRLSSPHGPQTMYDDAMNLLLQILSRHKYLLSTMEILWLSCLSDKDRSSLMPTSTVSKLMQRSSTPLKIISVSAE